MTKQTALQYLKENFGSPGVSDGDHRAVVRNVLSKNPGQWVGTDQEILEALRDAGYPEIVGGKSLMSVARNDASSIFSDDRDHFEVKPMPDGGIHNGYLIRYNQGAGVCDRCGRPF